MSTLVLVVLLLRRRRGHRATPQDLKVVVELRYTSRKKRSRRKGLACKPLRRLQLSSYITASIYMPEVRPCLTLPQCLPQRDERAISTNRQNFAVATVHATICCGGPNSTMFRKRSVADMSVAPYRMHGKVR